MDVQTLIELLGGGLLAFVLWELKTTKRYVMRTDDRLQRVHRIVVVLRSRSRATDAEIMSLQTAHERVANLVQKHEFQLGETTTEGNV